MLPVQPGRSCQSQRYLPPRAALRPWEGTETSPSPGCPDKLGWGSRNGKPDEEKQTSSCSRPGASPGLNIPLGASTRQFFPSRGRAEPSFAKPGWHWLFIQPETAARRFAQEVTSTSKQTAEQEPDFGELGERKGIFNES